MIILNLKTTTTKAMRKSSVKKKSHTTNPWYLVEDKTTVAPLTSFTALLSPSRQASNPL